MNDFFLTQRVFLMAEYKNNHISLFRSFFSFIPVISGVMKAVMTGLWRVSGNCTPTPCISGSGACTWWPGQLTTWWVIWGCRTGVTNVEDLVSTVLAAAVTECMDPRGGGDGKPSLCLHTCTHTVISVWVHTCTIMTVSKPRRGWGWRTDVEKIISSDQHLWCGCQMALIYPSHHWNNPGTVTVTISQMRKCVSTVSSRAQFWSIWSLE